MILVLKEADFSANNLGQVSIKTIDDVSPETLEIVSAMGRYVVGTDDDKIIALDDFIEAFDAFSGKSKVEHIYIPVAAESTEKASATSKCFYDFKNKRFSTSSDIKIDINDNRGFIKNGADGLYKVYVGSGTYNNGIVNVQERKNTNFHLFFEGKRNIGVYYPGAGDGSNVTINNNNTVLGNVGNANVFTSSLTLSEGIFGLSLLNAACRIKINEETETPIVKTSSTSYNVTLGLQPLVYENASSDVHNKLRFISVGEGFTEQEFNAYYSMIKRLMDVLNA